MERTEYGLKYSLVDKMDDNWSTYDKVIASTHLSRFGKIIIDGIGNPIDNEFDLREIQLKERLA